MKTHYEILGVPPNADPTTIKKAYHQISLRYHPDKNVATPEPEKSRRTKVYTLANIAQQTLLDDKKRAEYDRELRSRPQSRPQARPGPDRDGASPSEHPQNANPGSGFGFNTWNSQTSPKSEPRPAPPPPPPSQDSPMWDACGCICGECTCGPSTQNAQPPPPQPNNAEQNASGVWTGTLPWYKTEKYASLGTSSLFPSAYHESKVSIQETIGGWTELHYFSTLGMAFTLSIHKKFILDPKWEPFITPLESAVTNLSITMKFALRRNQSYRGPIHAPEVHMKLDSPPVMNNVRRYMDLHSLFEEYSDGRIYLRIKLPCKSVTIDHLGHYLPHPSHAWEFTWAADFGYLITVPSSLKITRLNFSEKDPKVREWPFYESQQYGPGSNLAGTLRNWDIRRNHGEDLEIYYPGCDFVDLGRNGRCQQVNSGEKVFWREAAVAWLT